MMQRVNAIFDHGVLRPLAPLDLQDQERVSLTIEKIGRVSSELGEQEPTLFELLDRAGLIGCVKDAPPDLSTNRRYLENFGTSGA